MNAISSFLPPPFSIRPYYHPSKRISVFYRREAVIDAVIRGQFAAAALCSSSSKGKRRLPIIPSKQTNLKAEIRPSDNSFLTDSQTNHDDELTYKQLKELVQLIQHHDELYYTPGLQPQISDDEYDALTRREDEILLLYPHLLARLEHDPEIVTSSQGIRWSAGRFQKNKEINPSNTFTITGEELFNNTNQGKISHLTHAPMQSLDNAMNPQQVVQWIQRVRKKLYTQSENVGKQLLLQLRAEPKLDGLSVSLRYRRQHDVTVHSSMHPIYSLVWGATRGDGQRGEDVTDAVLAMKYIQDDSKNSTSSFPRIKGKIPISFHLPSSFSSYTPEVIEIRGEVILPTITFHTMNQLQPSAHNSDMNRTFSNARNAASGILLRFKDQTAQEVEETQRLRSYLRFYAYGLEMSVDPSEHILPNNVTPYDDICTTLTEMGFTIPTPNETISLTLHPNETVTEQECNDLFHYHSSISTLYSRQSSSNNKNNNDHSNISEDQLDIDGAVYKVSNPMYRTLLGSSTRAPRWAIAHKYPPTCGVTQLLNIEIQVGRTGVLTPVAVLAPVDIAGVVIRRATLHNFIQAQKILQPDDKGYVSRGMTLVVCRAGDVIPQVVQRIGVASSKTETTTGEGDSWISLNPPKTCPSCGSRIIFESVNSSKKELKEEERDDVDTEENFGPILRCGGSPYSCTPRAVSALTHAFSRSGFNIQGISEARVQQLVNSKMLRYPADIFRILNPDDSFATMLSQMDGWGDKSTHNLVQQASFVKENGIELYQFIYSLGIRHVGLSSCKLVASSFGSVNRFLDALKEKNRLEEILLPVHGLGPKTLSSLVSFSEDDELVKAAHALANMIPIKDDLALSMSSSQSNVEEPLPLQGMAVVFTGSLGANMTRAKAQEWAVNVLGARSTSTTISKSTDLLIVGEKSGGKEKKAIEMKIKIMTGDEFLELIKKFT